MLVFLGFGISATAQTYNEHDKEALRKFLRQPSAVDEQINAQQLGLTIPADTANWYADELWVENVSNLTWNEDNPKRLTSIYCEGNYLAGTLDLSGCTALEFLYCSNNTLTSLDLNSCTALTELECMDNSLSNLNLNSCTALISLNCIDNLLITLDINNCTALKYFNCNNNSLETLNLSGCTALQSLNCSHNALTSLNVSGCTALQSLNCGYNSLITLNISNCTILRSLDCDNNLLTTLDINNCKALRFLFCYNNSLTTLDISSCTELEYLDCSSNHLYALDLSANASLATFWGDYQTVSLTLCNNGSGVYQLPITLNNPQFDNSAITYTNGILQSDNNTINSSSFNAATNMSGYNLSGTITFTYSENSGVGTFQAADLHLYPNPASDIVNFSVEAAYEIIDFQGCILLKSGKAEKSVNISGLPAGIYFVKTNNSTAKIVKK